MADPTTMPQHGPQHDGHPGDFGHVQPTPSPHSGPTSLGHEPGQAHARGGEAQNHHGRDKIDWGPEVWQRIDAAVKEEIARSRVASKFLPIAHVAAKTTTVPADIVNPTTQQNVTINALSIDETATTRIIEYWVEFSLTPAQVEEEAAAAASHGLHAHHEQHHPDLGHPPRHHHHHEMASTGISVATRAANILAQVEDSVIFQGQNVFDHTGLNPPGMNPGSGLIDGNNSPVNYRVDPTTLDLGLLNLQLPDDVMNGRLLPPLPSDQIVPVSPAQTAGGLNLYQEKTVAAIARAFSILQGKGQYGPYALALQTGPFADANSPLATTLITPAEPMRHLMAAGFHGTGTLPPFKDAKGTPGGGLNGGMGSGTIVAVVVTNGGSGYDPNNPPPNVSIGQQVDAKKNKVGTQASATATVGANGAITGVTIMNGGTGYTSPPTVTIDAPPKGGTQATAIIPQIVATGVVVSLGGNTMDLVRGKMIQDEDVVVRFEQKDVDGNYRFRVVERFALRLKDITAVVQLLFLSA
jgi:hypothetical protein